MNNLKKTNDESQDKKRFDSVRELMIQIYGENSEEYKRLCRNGVFGYEEKTEHTD